MRKIKENIKTGFMRKRNRILQRKKIEGKATSFFLLLAST